MPRSAFSPRFLYRAFGLCIASEVPLIELPPGSGEPDVQVSFGTVDGVSESSNDWTVIASPGEVRGWIPDAGAFLVRGGREMIIDPAPNADDRALRLGIVGPLLGVVLTQRGRFVLHASTVAIDGRAVSFCGPSGRGKSTLTAAMTRAGHVLVADDLTLIDAEHDPPIVQPGFARIKLWPDSATALEEDVAALPLIHPQREKRSLQLDRVESDALPIARCYLLEDGDAESVAEPNPREAILALIATTYQSQWLHETGAASANLAQCAALVRSGRVRRLQRRRDFAVLDEVVRFIERDVRALG